MKNIQKTYTPLAMLFLIFVSGGCATQFVTSMLIDYRYGHNNKIVASNQETTSLKELDSKKWHEGIYLCRYPNGVASGSVFQKNDCARFRNLVKSGNLFIELSDSGSILTIEPCATEKTSAMTIREEESTKTVFLRVGSKSEIDSINLDNYRNYVTPKGDPQKFPLMFFNFDLSQEGRIELSWKILYCYARKMQESAAYDIHIGNDERVRYEGMELGPQIVYGSMHLGYLVAIPLDVALLPLYLIALPFVMPHLRM